MKAIYTVLNRKIYRINQDTKEPKTLTSLPTNEHSVVSADTALKKVTASIFLSTMETNRIKSNKELYHCMKNTIEKEQITEIENIYNRYMMLIDYQMFDSKCEICHNVVTKPVDAADAAILLGVATNNELVYRRVKQFDPVIEFAVANQLPLGIMKTPDTEYHFKINDISLYQDTSSTPCCCHNSIYCTPYSADACGTVVDALSGYVRIYSTAAAGLQISDIDINFIPKTIDLRVNFTLASLIVAYDDADVITLMQRIIDEKYHPRPDVDPDTGHEHHHEGHLFPGKHDHKPADGDTTPDKDGWYDFYERCLSTNPQALLVVEDLIPDAVYKVRKMIKKKLVIKDIPNIQVGEYVRYVLAHDQNSVHTGNENDYEINTGDQNTNNESAVDGENTDDSFSFFEDPNESGETVGTIRGIPSARDRGATLDNSDTQSNMQRNMNGWEIVDVNEVLQ